MPVPLITYTEALEAWGEPPCWHDWPAHERLIALARYAPRDDIMRAYGALLEEV
jgi:hypothetical protein